MPAERYKKFIIGVIVIYIISAIAFECTENTARISTFGIYLVFAVGLFHFVNTNQFVLNVHCTSLILLCLNVFIMSFVNHNPMSETVVYYCLTCTVLCMFCYNMFLCTDKEKTISVFIFAFLLGTIILDIRVAQSYGGISKMLEFSSNGVGLYERRVGGDIINENTLGLYNANSFFCCLILYNKKKKEKPNISRFFLVISIVFVAMILLTASKKAFTFLVIGFAIFSVMSFRSGNIKKKIVILSSAVIGVFLIYYMISNVPFFHSVKLRFNELFMTISPDNSFASETDKTRIYMTNEGLSAFLDSPLFGNGTAYSYTIFQGAYSHNNFIELLMSYGIIGFAIYYTPYIFLLIRLYKLMRERDLYALYFFIFILMHIFLGVGWVNYYERVTQLYTIFAVGYAEKETWQKELVYRKYKYIKSI